MGYNTTVVVMNDAIDQIANDPQFGRKLADSIMRYSSLSDRVDISAGCHANAAHVVESHHADCTAIITVGGNLGVKQLTIGGYDHHLREGQLRLLREWAEKMGYELKAVSPEAKADAEAQTARRRSPSV